MNKLLRRSVLATVAAAAVLTLSDSAIGTAAGPNHGVGHGRCPLPQGGDTVSLSKYDFTTRVTNSLWPMTPGTTWRYRESDTEGEHQRIDVRVLHRTKPVAGVETTVVRDVAREGGRSGQLVEDTFDWYAQDKCGNVWYFGENTREYRNGNVVSREGSWETGVDGAQPGVIVPAHPVVALVYRQEYLADVAEDQARVMSLDEKAMTPSGYYRHTVLTAESTPLEPRVSEYKFLAPGVGPVLAVGISGESDREELVEVSMPPEARRGMS